MNYRLLASIFTRAPTAVAADAHQERLLALLHAFAPQPLAAPQAHGRIPGYYEHSFVFAPPSQAAFEALVALVPERWHRVDDGERSAVWHPAPGCEFLLPEVAWAELLLVHASGERA